jgi:pimeloyl-ACP methyl ester carboxylesterase
MGGGTALQMAIDHPARLLSVVPISASVRPEGAHPDLSDPSTYATSTRMPTEEDFAAMSEAYARLSPHPDQFDALPMRTMTTVDKWTGWTDEELAAITAPVLIVLGDHDFTVAAHGAVMQDLIPGSQLAILPGTTHMQAPRRADLLLPMLDRFLD